MRIGTRGSALALAQAHLVAELLDARPSGPHPPTEVVTIATAGDRDLASGEAGSQRRPPEAEVGGDKSRWVLELERALSAGEIDLAVHSAKDVPGELADGLALFGAPERAAPEDVLCGTGGLEQLPPGARVGTSSVRRAAQLRAAREDLEVVSMRGNVDTRLRKLREGGCDAIVLARAGLHRLGREEEIAAVLDPARFVPAPGQGILALEGRAADERTRKAVEAITDAAAFASLRAERALAHTLGASCNTPLGAHAYDYGCGCLHLRAWVGLPDGSAWVGDELLGGFYDPDALGRRVAERLLSAGAGELLRQAEELAVAGRA
ncbi:MAG TPA: hydroxymethylbilane synthase [Solirubrobacteraceae bacterium]|jgi:hydroxymethylbilane synthase|nr:hydroxymethylbilane synthase [Solirubrobacteraceae bacterium]